MKRLFAVLLSLALMLPAGCGASGAELVPEEVVSPASAEAAPSTPEDNGYPRVPLPVTEEAVRAVYEAEERVVLEITPYENDFLVWYGFDHGYRDETSRYVDNSRFEWVYGTSGLRCPLLHCDRDVTSYEIPGSGAVEVLTGQRFANVSGNGFPVTLRARAALALGEDGEPLPYFVDSGVQETYWAPVSEGHTVGLERREVLVDARLTIDSLELVFGPPADPDGLSGFYAAASWIPLVEISCDESGRQMTLTCRETALTSGDPPRCDDADLQENYTQWLLDTGTELPTSFPAGTLTGANPFLQQAEVRERGGDTLITLTLTEDAGLYTVETGQLLRNESRPYLRLTFQESH